MNALQCILLLAAIFVQYIPNTDSQFLKKAEEGKTPSIKTNEIVLNVNKKIYNATAFPEQSNSSMISETKLKRNLGMSVTETTKIAKNNSKELNLMMIQKQDPENETLNNGKPFFLFPTLPLLFPKENEISNLVNNKMTMGKPKEFKDDTPKPFIFFKYAFNIRQIPWHNSSEHFKDSQIVNVNKLHSNQSGGMSEGEFQKISKPKDLNSFFFDFPLFPDSGIEDFLAKSDLLFPNLSFNRKPVRNPNRRKRDMKKLSLNNDLKFIMNFFDEALEKTKREIERTNPILDFLRGAEEGNRKHEFFNSAPGNKKAIRKVPTSNEPNEMEELRFEENPVIVVDKGTKIREVHLHDNHENLKSKQNKKKETSSMRMLNEKIFNYGDDLQKQNFTNRKTNMGILEKLKESRKKKRSHDSKLGNLRRAFSKIESKEINISPSFNGTLPTSENNSAVPLKFIPNTDPSDLIKVVTSLKNSIKKKISDRKARKDDKLNLRSENDNENSKALFYNDLEKNITRVLTQFLVLFKKLDNAMFDANDAASFDWMGKEPIQNGNLYGKRQKKDTVLLDDYTETEKEERKVANLNYLFLTVTLPTIIVSAVLLLVCFLNFRIKGKICRSLFKPRNLYVIEEENALKTVQKTNN